MEKEILRSSGSAEAFVLLARRLPGVRAEFYGLLYDQIVHLPGASAKRNFRMRDENTEDGFALAEKRLPALLREMESRGLDVCRLENVRDLNREDAPRSSYLPRKAACYLFRVNDEIPAELSSGFDSGRPMFCLALCRKASELPPLDLLLSFSRFIRRLESEGSPQASMKPGKHFKAARPGAAFRKLHRDYQALQNDYSALWRDLKARDDALARLVHDLRLPLANIKLQCETQKNRLKNRLNKTEGTNAGDSRQESETRNFESFLRDLEDRTRALENLADDILQLKTTGKRKPGGTEHVSLLGTLLELSRGYEQALKRKRIRLEVRGSESTPCLVGAHGLERILHNLLSNAVKFCSSPGEIQAEVRTQDGFQLLEIEDSGPGFDPGDSAFAMARENIGRAGGGWGIGLASAAELARVSGGNLTPIPSKFGSGARFLLVLPAAPDR